MLNDLVLGGNSDDAMTVLRDRSYMEQMKPDILRRVEAPSDSEDDDEVNIFGVAGDRAKGRGKGKMREVAFDDELDDVGGVRVAGDGEESSAAEDKDGDEDETEEEEGPEVTPQTIVELAYIADPKVFERDAATRRSKERAALRAQTGASGRRASHSLMDMVLDMLMADLRCAPVPKGWVDEQIEGFRIMLDRDVRPSKKILALRHTRTHGLTRFCAFFFLYFSQPKLKEKVLARHEFRGNKPLAGMASSSGPGARSRSRSGTPDAQPGRGRGEGGRGRRGQGRGRGRGRGRGGTTGPETGGSGGRGDGGDAQSRAWKDKNKARQANHDRKRGHDKKMAKAGGPSS